MKTDFRKILGTLLIAIAASSITLAIYSKKEGRHFGGTSYFNNQTPARLAGYSGSNMPVGGYPDFNALSYSSMHFLASFTFWKSLFAWNLCPPSRFTVCSFGFLSAIGTSTILIVSVSINVHGLGTINLS